jgi:hypothetical protein
LLEADPDAFETVFDSRRAGFRQTDAAAILEAALTRWQSQSRRKLASFVASGVRNDGWLVTWRWGRGALLGAAFGAILLLDRKDGDDSRRAGRREA